MKYIKRGIGLKLFLAFGIFFFLLSCSESWRLIRVIDGDTIRATKSGKEEKVRLKGVDAPEIPHPDFGKLLGEPFGYESKACLARILDGHPLRLTFDTPDGRPERDDYGRLLAYVYAGETLVNSELIRQGCARAYRRFPHSKLSEFIRLEEQARAEKIGLWALASEP